MLNYGDLHRFIMEWMFDDEANADGQLTPPLDLSPVTDASDDDADHAQQWSDSPVAQPLETDPYFDVKLDDDDM